jgi:hypothetical protein
MDERRDQRLFWIVLFALLLLTRVPSMAGYFGVDNINLAFSLETFDPRVHQPQPPGYPLFVAASRFLNFFFRDAARTFLASALIVSALCLWVTYALGKRMFSRAAGAAGALLLVVNPVFWFGSIDPNGGPLRPYLALFSLLTAYCCWRAWSGEPRFVLWGAVAIGIGGGFRPDLLPFLFPIWFLSSAAGAKSWRSVAAGCAIAGGIVAVWSGALILAMRGETIGDDARIFMKLMSDYAVDQSPESVVFGSSAIAWLRQVNRLVIWNGLAIVSWIWIVPAYLWRRRTESSAVGGRHMLFFVVWLLPGLLTQALIHVATPGHTLFSVVAFCVLGGYFVSIAPAREIVTGAAIVLNMMFFLDFFPLPAGAKRDGPSIKNAVVFGVFESSIGQVRFLDEVTRTTLEEIARFTPKDRPSVVLSTNTFVKEWFMNWRIGRYYLPNSDFWILYENQPIKRAERIRRDSRLEVRETPPLRIPVFNEGRILWVLEPGSEIQKRVAETQKLEGGRYVFYSDITKESPPFRVDDFEIVPSLLGFMPQAAVSTKR